MFDIAPTELLLCAVVALLVIGPKDLPGIDDLRAAGLLDPVDLAMAAFDLDDDELESVTQKD